MNSQINFECNKSNSFLQVPIIFIFTISLSFSAFSQNNTFPSSGNVGIGTTNPSTPLNIVQSGPTAVRFDRSGHDSYLMYLGGSQGLYFHNDTDNRYELIFDGTGNIGIGHLNPNYKLQVGGETRTEKLFINISDSYSSHPSEEFHVTGDARIFEVDNQPASLGISAGWSKYFMESWGDRPNEISLKNDESTGDWQMVGPYSYDAVNDGHRLMFRYYTGDNTNDQFNTLTGEYLSVRDNGNVGIGIASPSSKLHVYGDMTASRLSTEHANLNLDAGWSHLNMDSWGDRPNEIRLNNEETGSAYWQILGPYSYDAPTDGNRLIFRFNTDNDNGIHSGKLTGKFMSIRGDNGNVGIGTSAPTQRLSVAGKINAEELILEDVIGADFVFEEDYDLRTLEETEQFIQANKHLPEVPSAAEMAEEGLAIKEMNILLLQKVEELTLHLIRMEKEAQKLTSKVLEQEEKILNLEAAQNN